MRDGKRLLRSHESFLAPASVPSWDFPAGEPHAELVPQEPPRVPEIPQDSEPQRRSLYFLPDFPLACCGCQDNRTALQCGSRNRVSAFFSHTSFLRCARCFLVRWPSPTNSNAGQTAEGMKLPGNLSLSWALCVMTRLQPFCPQNAGSVLIRAQYQPHITLGVPQWL